MRAANLSPSRSGRPCVASKSRSLHDPSSSISRWYFQGSAVRRGATGSGPRATKRPSAAPARRRAENGGKERCWRRKPALGLGHAAARNLRQWRVSDCADHWLASIEQPGLGGGRRRDDDFSRTVHRIAALGRGERHTVALEGPVHHRRGPSKRRRSGGGGDFQANEEGRDGQSRAAAPDEISRKTPHGLLPTIPVFISRGNPRIGSCAALRFLQSRARAVVFG